MPTYEYRCKDCSHQFDVFQAFTDDALTECPECQGRLKKVFGNVGITFKGSGFYKTDSRSGGSSGESSGDGGSKESTSSKESSSGPSSESGSSTTKGEGSGSKDSGSKDSGAKGSKDSGSSSGGSKAPAGSTS
jgi:putative FmdB family regulatory protein